MERPPRIDRGGARRLMVSTGGSAGSGDNATPAPDEPRGAINHTFWRATTTYVVVVGGLMIVSVHDPQHAWSSSGFLRSPPDSGAGDKESMMTKKISAVGVVSVVVASQAMAATSLADGYLVMWGQNDYGQTNSPTGRFRQLNSGATVSVGIDADGNLRRWSTPPQGEPRIPPAFLAGPFIQVCGRTTTCALRANGEIEIWACDDQGSQCGLAQPPAGPFVQVAAGVWHAAALRADGTIVTWGCTFSPWNGDSVSAQPGGQQFSRIACGDWNTHAIRADGSISSAGYSFDGANNAPSGNGYVRIAGGWGHGIALRTDGSLVGWGRNGDGESSVPPGTFTDIAAGGVTSMALRIDGTVTIWGRCSGYVSGTYWTACNPPSVGRVVQISASDYHAGVIVDDTPRCTDADLYPNGRIDGADLAALLSEWGPVNPTTHSDFDHDGRVAGADLAYLLANWGPCPQ